MFSNIDKCPLCKGTLEVKKIYCGKCEISFEGNFSFSKIGKLTREQQMFIEKFILANGSLKQLEKDIGMSYPALRSRLDKIIADLVEFGKNDDKLKNEILNDIESGKISADEAARLIELL